MKQETPKYLEILVYLSGPGFRPENLPTQKFKVKIISSTGILKPTGRYKDQPSPHGLCYFMLPTIKTAVKFVEKIRQLPNTHIDESYIHLFFRGYQGNMSLSRGDLQQLARLKTSVLMNYDYETPE